MMQWTEGSGTVGRLCRAVGLALGVVLAACDKSPPSNVVTASEATASSVQSNVLPPSPSPAAHTLALPPQRVPLDALLVTSARDLAEASAAPAERGALEQELRTFVESREARCGAAPKDDEGSAAVADCIAKLDTAQARVFGRRLLAIRLHAEALVDFAPVSDAMAPLLEVATVETARVSDDGRLVAVLWNRGERYADGGVALFTHADGHLLANVPLPYQPVCAQFSANRRVLFLTSHPDAPGQLRRLTAIDVANGHVMHEEDGVTGQFRLLPDARLIALGMSVQVFDLLQGITIASAAPRFSEFALSVTRAGDMVTTNGQKLTRWRVIPSGKGFALEAAAVQPIHTDRRSGSVRSVRHSVDGRSVLVATEHGLSVFDANSLALLRSANVGDISLFGTGFPVPVVGGHWYAQSVKRADRREALVWDPVDMRGAIVEDAPSSGVLFGQSLRAVAQRIVELDVFAAPSPAQARPLDELGAAAAGVVSPVPALPAAVVAATIESIGVYEGARIEAPPGATQARNARHPIEIAIGATDRPIVLVLASYEPVEWRVRGNGHRVQEVLLSGSTGSAVTGLDGAEVTQIGPHSGYNAAQTPGFYEVVKRYTGRTPDRFQGAYRGEYFAIGRGAPGPTTKATARRDSLTILTEGTDQRIVIEPRAGSRPAITIGKPAEEGAAVPVPTKPGAIYRNVNERGVTEFSDKPRR